MSQVPRNLDTLDYTALDKIEAQIKARKAQLFQEAEAKARSVLDKIGQAVGAKFEFVPPALPSNGNGVHKAKGGKVKHKIPVRFRDPSKPENTWTGRGRMPRWMAAAIKDSGKTKDAFRI